MTKTEKSVTTFAKLATSIQLNPYYDPAAVIETTNCYLYCPETFVATSIMQMASNELPPDNSTQWAPPQCSPDAQAYFNGAGWSCCPVYASITPELLRATLIDVAKRELRNSMLAIKAQASDDETDTYLQQYSDAQTYTRTGEASTFLMVLSDARNKTVDDLVRVITRKADAYHTATAKALASYQNAVDAIMNTEPVLTQALLHERRLQRI